MNAKETPNGFDWKAAGYPPCKRCGDEPANKDDEGKVQDGGLCSQCYKKSKTCGTCGKFTSEGLKNYRCEVCIEEIRKTQQELYDPRPQPQIADRFDRSQELSLGKFVDEDGNESRFVVQRMDTIQAERLEWIWKGKLPRGMFSIFSGRMGSGKGLTWADITARITTGRDWPDGAPNTLGGPKMVLIVATEDDAPLAVRPRLETAGTDLKKVLWFKRTEKIETVRRKASKVERMLLLERDLVNLARTLTQHPEIVLVILDPLNSFFSIKMTDDKEMRPVMDQVSKMCAISGTTLLAVSHTNKRSDIDSTQRVLGASCVAGTARIIWNFAHDPDDKEVRLMSLVKSNIGATAGQKFRVKETNIKLVDGTDAETVCCEWLGQHNEDADEVASRAKDNRQQGDHKVDLATAFIRLNLSTGIKMASELYELAEQQEGLSVDVMKRAKNKLGNIQVRKIGHHWHWGTKQQFADDPVMEPEVMEAAM